MRDEPKPPARIEEKHRRRVVLACFDLEFGGGSRRRRGVAVQREEAFVERAHIPGQDLGLVVLRIHAHEDHLDALAVLT
jgi:hypothetical protein